MRLLIVCLLALLGVGCQKEIHEVRAPAHGAAVEATLVWPDRAVPAPLSVAPSRHP